MKHSLLSRARVLWLMLLAAVIGAPLATHAALSDLVTMTSTNVTFAPTAVSGLMSTAVASVIVAGLVLAIAIFGGKFIWRIFKGFLGKA